MEFTDNSIIASVLQWNYSQQKFDARVWFGFPVNKWQGNITIDPFPGGHLSFGITAPAPYQWKPQVMGL
jgi:hypothetical protein